MSPDGDPTFDRVVDAADAALAAALDRATTGRLVLEPQATLLLDADRRCVLSLVDGAPVAAHHPATGRGGADAVADLRGGPYRAALYPDGTVGPDGHGQRALDPGTPARLLAGDPGLADRSRERAPPAAGPPADREDDPVDAVAAFLADEETVERIRERARAEAERKAEEWGFD